MIASRVKHSNKAVTPRATVCNHMCPGCSLMHSDQARAPFAAAATAPDNAGASHLLGVSSWPVRGVLRRYCIYGACTVCAWCAAWCAHGVCMLCSAYVHGAPQELPISWRPIKGCNYYPEATQPPQLLFLPRRACSL